MSDYTVEVNIKDLEDEIKKNIDIIIHNLLKRFIEENKIETLYKIIFTDNWDEEITDFQKNNNLLVEYTDSQYGSASAKTLHIKIGENIKNVIFFRKETLLSIVKQEGYGILLLFHELSHVYYFETIGNRLDELKKSYKKINNLFENTKDFGLNMWEEYFVSRYLCNYLFGNTDCFVETLVEQYKKIEDDIKKEIEKYRYNGNINELFALAKEQTTLLSTYSAYSCGMVKALNDEKNELYKKTCDYISNETKLWEIWNKMYIIYDEIYDDFPRLENVDTKLNELVKLYISIYNIFGIYPEQLKDGRLYVSVPF